MKKKAKEEVEQGPIRKEVYELWWEYLKRNEDYRKFCETMKSLRKKESDDYFTVYERVEKKIMSDGKTKEEQEELYHKCYYWLEMYERYGNVLYDSFQDWWNRDKRPYKRPIINVSESQKDTKLSSYQGYFLVAVPVFGNVTIKDIAAEISSIRIKYQNDERIAELYNQKEAKQDREPVGRIRVDELKRYLKVYDLRMEGRKIREIAKVLGMDEKDAYETRKIYSDLKKATAIINNVGDGYFPGEY